MFFTVFYGIAAFGKDGPPPGPDKPWAPPGLDAYEMELAHERRSESAVGINAEKVYDLQTLIDIAERNNPETKIAWERARQAAAAVGLHESAYFPYLVASAGVGYDRAFIPFPTMRVDTSKILGQVAASLPQIAANPQAALEQLATQNADLPNVSIVGGGTLSTEVVASRAALSVKWLLLDFGERGAAVDAAKQRLMMANVGFNGTHQKVVFEVTRLFYTLNMAREKVAIAASALRAADTVGQATQARFDHGLATKPEVLQAEQQTAQAAFDLEAARGAESNARIALVESLGIAQPADLKIVKVTEKPVPAKIAEPLDTLIERALSQRPDLVAKLARLRASRAELKKVRAEYYPKVALDAHAGWLDLEVSAEDSPYFGGSDPVYGVGVAVELPIFDGFARANKMRIAESELRSAESELEGARDAVTREVWKAYTDLRVALRKQDSAARLLAAADSAFAASLEAYQQGLGTYLDVVNAQRNLTAARGIDVDTRASIYTGSAALALSVGDLARPVPKSTMIRKK